MEAMATMHPTKLALIRATMSLLDEVGDAGFTVDDVLARSNISRGSMYHHFHDFDDLINNAHVMRFSDYVDEDIQSLARVVADCNTVEQFLERIAVLAREIHSTNRQGRRAQRVTTMARAAKSDSMRVALAAELARMTDSLADLFREMQERGIVRRDFSPKMYATFIQAYSLGKIVDDVTADPIDPDEWTNFVMNMLAGWSTAEVRV